MSFLPYKDESRKNYGVYDVKNLALDQLQIGALLRIADACEMMAKDRDKLEREAKWQRERADSNYQACERLRRSNAALKGQITRLRKKLAEASDV